MSDLFLITDEKALSFKGSEVRKIEVHLQTDKDVEEINSLDGFLKRMYPICKVKLVKLTQD